MGEGGDWLSLPTGVIAEFPGVAIVNKVTPVSLKCPLSIFNNLKNSTLREKWSCLLHGAEEEHGKECPWELGELNGSVEWVEGWFLI